MRIFHFELRKILSWRPFWLITAVMLIINGYIIIKQQNESLNSPSDYTSLYDEIKDMPDNEKLEYIQNKLDTFWDNTENIEKSDIMPRYELLSEFQAQLENITEYADYIESAAKSSGSNIFNIDKNSFAYKSNQKTAAAYSDMNDVKPVFDISEGILLATDSKVTDIMCVFLLFIAAICLIVRDKEYGITPLIRSSSNGRSVLACNQSLVILVLSFITVTFFYCENVMIGLAYYGFGDLLRPIQSVSGFISCNLHLNVLSYLIIYYLTKVFALWIIGMIFAVICLCSKNNVIVYALSVFISVIEVCAWAFISETSVFSLLHFIDPVNFICVNDTFKKYTCINIFNVPFSAIAVMYFSMTVILLLLNILFICISDRIKNISYKNISVLNRLSSLLNLKSHQFTSFGYTVYNSMIVQKSVFVLIGFIVIVSAIGISFKKPYDINDVYYSYYCTQLEEKSSEEISVFLESEAERYADLYEKLNKLASNNGSEHEIESLEKQLEPESAFQKVFSRAIRLSELNEDNTGIFYDTGYERFFSFDSREILIFTLLKTVIIILLISPLFAFNNMYGLNKVIFSTAFGKQRYIISNVILTLIYSVLISAAMDISFFFKIIDEYGIHGIDKSVYSIGVFDGFPINMTMKCAIIMVIVFKAAMTFLISLLILFISYYSKSISSSALISLLLFAVPVLIAVLNIKSFVSVGFTPFLIGTKVILDFNTEMVVAPMLVGILIISGLLKRRKIFLRS